jgi:EpsI family protein
MQHQPTDHILQANYSRGSETVSLFVALFPKQTQGAEAINKDNQLAENIVRSVSLGRESVSLGSERVRVNRYRAVISAEGRPGEYLAWQWFRVAGHSVTNRYAGKAWEAVARLYPGRADGAWIAIATSSDELDNRTAQRRLRNFAEHIGPAIAAEIDRFVGQE